LIYFETPETPRDSLLLGQQKQQFQEITKV